MKHLKTLAVGALAVSAIVAAAHGLAFALKAWPTETRVVLTVIVGIPLSYAVGACILRRPE